MMSLEAVLMIGLAAAAVTLAYTQLKCPVEPRFVRVPEGDNDDLSPRSP